jgi:hypothetical protein
MYHVCPTVPSTGIWRAQSRATGKVHIALRGVYGAYAAIHDLESGARGEANDKCRHLLSGSTPNALN